MPNLEFLLYKKGHPQKVVLLHEYTRMWSGQKDKLSVATGTSGFKLQPAIVAPIR